MTSDKLGKLFVFEGVDGVGKSTITQKASEYLTHRGIENKVLSFPGNEKGTLGNTIYKIHHNPEKYGIGKLNPTSCQILHIASHIELIEEKIIPLMKKGIHIILDRYWWSTFVYGIVNGVSVDSLKAMITLELLHLKKDFLPTTIFLIDRQEPFREEMEKAKWELLRNEYLKLKKDEPKGRVSYVKNDTDLSKVVTPIGRHILKKVEPQNTQKKRNQLRLFLPISPAKPTKLYEYYWRFAAERQNIFFKKQFQSYPWTKDPILEEYKFTNAYRASDRVSQYLIKNVIYSEDYDNSPQEILFRILLFKIFNKIETWELITKKLGEISYKSYRYKRYDRVLMTAMKNKSSIYSGAYIMASGKSFFGFEKKHQNHLKLIDYMFKDGFVEKVESSNSMQELFEILRSYPTVGNFLAFQYAIDINYSEITDFSEMDFVFPGPGAKDGIRKCFSDLGGLNEIEIIKLMADKQEEEFDRLNINFKSLWGRPLQLIDCQNIFCEIDKYSRVAFPDIQGISKRKRIKQKYKNAISNKIDYWYPPKWGINKRIKNKGESFYNENFFRNNSESTLGKGT